MFLTNLQYLPEKYIIDMPGQFDDLKPQISSFTVVSYLRE